MTCVLRFPSHPVTQVGAASFNAAGDYLYRTGVTMPGSTPFSIFTWFYVDTLRSATSLIAGLLKADGTQYQGAYVNSANLISIQTNVGVTTGTALIEDTWYCMLYTRNAGDHKLYLGTESSPMTLDISRTDNNTVTVDFYLAGSNSVGYIDGRLALLRTWNAELSLAEGNIERTSLTAVRTANIYSSTPLSTASDLADVSGNGYNWSAAGTLGTATGPTI